MTTRLESFRDHCKRMATAQHKPECPSLTAREPYWSGWAPIDPDTGEWDTTGGFPRALGFLGTRPPWKAPKCDGCVSDDDRALFGRLASEADQYMQGELWEGK